MGNCPQMNLTGPYRRQVNIGSGNGLLPSGNTPLLEPMLTSFMLPYGVTKPRWVKLNISPHGHCSDDCDRSTLILPNSLEDLWPESDLLNQNKIRLCFIKCARICRLSQRLFLLMITRRSDMEALSTLPALYEGNPMSVMQTFHTFFGGSLIKLVNKLSSCRVFETPQRVCEFTIMNGMMCGVGLSQNTHSVGASYTCMNIMVLITYYR